MYWMSIVECCCKRMSWPESISYFLQWTFSPPACQSFLLLTCIPSLLFPFTVLNIYSLAFLAYLSSTISVSFLSLYRLYLILNWYLTTQCRQDEKCMQRMRRRKCVRVRGEKGVGQGCRPMNKTRACFIPQNDAALS